MAHHEPKPKPTTTCTSVPAVVAPTSSGDIAAGPPAAPRGSSIPPPSPASSTAFAPKLGPGIFSCTYYCGRFVGIKVLPESDGFCGPSSGPQCADCRKFQDNHGPAPKLGIGKGARNYYCGCYMGRNAVTGSLNFCGPFSGPQCFNCCAYQQQLTAGSQIVDAGDSASATGSDAALLPSGEGDELKDRGARSASFLHQVIDWIVSQMQTCHVLRHIWQPTGAQAAQLHAYGGCCFDSESTRFPTYCELI